MSKFKFLTENFFIPVLVLIGILLYLALQLLNVPLLPFLVILPTVLIGSYQLFRDSYFAVLKGQYALDYIAIIAIAVSLFTSQYLVAAVLALMIASGRTLEEYGAAQARSSLTKLVDRIPRDVYLWENNEIGKRINIEAVDIDQEIFIRKG